MIREILEWFFYRITRNKISNHRFTIDGTESWHDNQFRLHRVNGPAVIYNDGTLWWMEHGNFHRDDGPARISSNGFAEYYVHGIRHREDGPAIQSIYGHINIDPGDTWWINGKDITDDVKKWIEENNIVYPFDNETKVEFKLKFL